MFCVERWARVGRDGAARNAIDLLGSPTRGLGSRARSRTEDTNEACSRRCGHVPQRRRASGEVCAEDRPLVDDNEP